MKIRYLKKYQFEHSRIILISHKYQIYDSGFCVSNPYRNLQEAEDALKKFVVKTLGLSYMSKIEL